MDGRRNKGPTVRSQQWKKQLATKRKNRPSMTDHVTKKEMMGGRIPVPENPPDVAYQPWFHFTMVITGTSKIDIKIKDLNTYFKQQLDPQKSTFIQQEGNTKGSFRVQFKIFSAKAWNLTGRVITLVVSDINDIGKTVEQLCGLVDTGSPSHTPCVGYLMPAAYRGEIIRADVTMEDHHLILTQGGSGDKVLLQIRMAWRPDGPIVPVSIMDNSSAMVRNLEDIRSDTSLQTGMIKTQTEMTSRIRDLIKEVSGLVRAMKSNQPSTTEKVVNGVRQVASFVLPLVLEEFSDGFSDMQDDIEELRSAFSTLGYDVSDEARETCFEGAAVERIQ